MQIIKTLIYDIEILRAILLSGNAGSVTTPSAKADGFVRHARRNRPRYA